jgi:GlpG protein
MLMITSFTNPRVAQAFVDYMQTQGVILTIQHHSQAISGWRTKARPSA